MTAAKTVSRASPVVCALHGVAATTEVAVGPKAERVILEAVRSRQVDLLVLGTSIGTGSERLFLGPTVERILGNAPCSVIVLNTKPG